MKTNHLILLLVIGLIITGATVVIANPEDAMRRYEKPGFNPMAQIDLSTEQTEQIRKLRLAHEKSIMPLKLQERQIKAELNIFWLQLSPDLEKIKSAQKNIHDIKFQIMEQKTDFHIAMREVLTEDQLSRFLALGGDRWHGPDKSVHRPPRLQQQIRY